jgi:hypothetical protein
LSTGYTGPILVSETSSFVTYNGGGPNYGYLGTISYNGKTYYYSKTDYFMSGDLTDTSGLGRQKLTATTSANAALELVKRYFYDGY